MEYWCSIQSATTATAQGPSNPVERDHISTLHWGAPSIALMASWGLPGWWMAEQPDKDPPASFIFLVSKIHLFFLSSFQHHIPFCPAEPRYECAYWVFIVELRPWALWNSQEPFGRRALQVQALTEWSGKTAKKQKKLCMKVARQEVHISSSESIHYHWIRHEQSKEKHYVRNSFVFSTAWREIVSAFTRQKEYLWG